MMRRSPRARRSTRVSRSIQRQLSALPSLGALRNARAQFQPLATCRPRLRMGDRAPELHDEAMDLSARDEAIAREIDKMVAALGAIVVDEVALAAADRVDRLDDLHARYVTEQRTSLPAIEAREAEQQITLILGRIGAPQRPTPAADPGCGDGRGVAGPDRRTIRCRSCRRGRGAGAVGGTPPTARGRGAGQDGR